MLVVGYTGWVRRYRIMEAPDCKLYSLQYRNSALFGEVGYTVCL